MLHSVLNRFQVPVEHCAVGVHPQLVSLPVNPKPIIGNQLAVGDFSTNGRPEHLRTTTWQCIYSCGLHRDKDVAGRRLFDSRQVSDLHRRERLEVHRRMPFL